MHQTATATAGATGLQSRLSGRLHVRCSVSPLTGLPVLRPGLSRTSCFVPSSLICSGRSTSSSQALGSCSGGSLVLPSSRYSISSSQPQQQGNRWHVVTAARPRKSEEQPADTDSPESISRLTVAELRARLEQLGLPTSGKKAELVARLTEHLQDSSSGGAAPAEEQVQAAAPAASPDGVTAADGAELAVGGEDVEYEELVAELEAELQGYDKAELVRCLQDRDLPVTGSKKALVSRLAVAVATESLAGGPLDASEGQQQDKAQQTEAAQQQQPPGQGAAGPVGDDEQRKWAVADKQQDYYDQLLRENVTREDLLKTLAEYNVPAADNESIEELVERVSWLLAEEEQQMVEQQQQQPLEGEELPESPSSVLDTITATEINKMKVDDLKAYLRQLGLSDEGGRYELRDRLMAMLVVRRAATAGDMDHLLSQLSQMTMSELRVQLESRGLSLSGSKAALELRLAEALVIETVGPEAAAAMGKLSKGEEDEQPGDPLLEDYDELLTAAVDPAMQVAVICGTAPILPSSSSSSTAAKLQRVSAALATANTLIDELHTAPLDEEQAAAMAAAAAAAANGSSSQPKSGGAPAIPLCGISVDIYWANDQGTFYQLPRTAVAALAPADIAARLPALATATFADAAALAKHLAESGVQAALSTLPGGALAMSGKLSEAFETAGVPLAGGPAYQNDKSQQLAGTKGPVFGRAAVLQELQGFGYNTLPVLQISRQELLAAAKEVSSWLELAEADIAESVTAAEGLTVADLEGEQPDAAAAAEEDAEEDDSSSSGAGSSSSELLRTWTGRPEDGEPAAVAAADAAAVEQEQQQQQEQEQQHPQHPQQPQLPALVERIVGWCRSSGMDPDLQVFTVSSSDGGDPVGCARGYIALVRELLATLETDPSLPGLLVEPLYRKLVRWEVAVLSSAEDGPVALIPAELEQYSVLEELADADLALQEWQMMQEGVEEEEISQALDALAAPEPPVLDLLKTPVLPEPMPFNTLKVHMPPRASNKVTQTIRHAAAKAVAQLGLEPAGLVRVSGWLAVKPDWQEHYTLPPEALQHMPDYDAGQLARLAREEAERRASEPHPLCEYFDDELHLADLAAFDQAQRMTVEGNGEADVLIGAVDVDVPLASCSVAGLQALELGISPGGVARHLINLALLKHGKDDQLLPPPAAPATEGSAQWAQVTGANDSLPEIMQQLADEAVEARQEADNAEYKAEVEAERVAFVSQPVVDAVTEVLAGLTTGWLTEEELAEPPEEAEEWSPEFDTRTQDEINAERDAGRTEEDLAARTMRDEGLFMYGNQPIKYDRWDDGDDWVPPAFTIAEAVAEGKPYPSMKQLQEQVEQQQQAKRQELLDRAYSPDEKLPEVTEDEVLVGRMVGHDRYRGGVIETLQRRANEQGGDAGSIAAAAAVAAASEAAATGEELSVAPAGEGSAADDSWRRWPWPDEKEVVDEAVLRRPAPRVWVIVGGDGLQRQQAFRSGANMAAKLQRCCDLQVDVFLMPPAGCGENEARRRAALLSRRTEWRALGIPEKLYPDSMSDEALLDMGTADVPLLNRQIIVAGPQQLARPTIEEAAEAAERAASRMSQTYHGAHVLQKQQQESQFETQMELDAHYVQGVGIGWGASAEVLPPAPRFMDLQELLDEADACDATLLLMLDDSSVASGQLQQVLEGSGLAYTGMTADFAIKCSNRITLSKSIDEIVESLAIQATYSEDAATAAAGSVESTPVGLVAVPKKIVKLEELMDFLQRPSEFDEAYYSLLYEWEDSSSVVLKPPTRSGGMGIIRVSSPQDLTIVAQTFSSATPIIPAGTLTHQPLPITLPMSLPELLVVEPWIDTDPVEVAANGEVQWAGSSRWVEVSVGLIGELGCMTALQPTFIAHAPDGSRLQFTPAPQHILPAAAVEAVQGFAVALADGLGLRSIACVDGFVNVDSGELVVMDVNPLPDLRDGSPVLQQVLANDPPMLPYQLFRLLAQQAYVTNASAIAAQASGAASAGSAYYAPAGADGGSGFGAEDFDLGTPADQGLGPDLFGGAQDDDEGGVVEDADIQGMAAGWTRQ